MNKDTAPDHVHSLSSFSQYLLDSAMVRTPLLERRVDIQLSGNKVANIPVNLGILHNHFFIPRSTQIFVDVKLVSTGN
jgi:hypothetical protein